MRDPKVDDPNGYQHKFAEINGIRIHCVEEGEGQDTKEVELHRYGQDGKAIRTHLSLRYFLHPAKQSSSNLRISRSPVFQHVRAQVLIDSDIGAARRNANHVEVQVPPAGQPMLSRL